MKFEKLINLSKPLLILSVLAGSFSLATGCKNDGPFEEAGEEIDNAADEIGDEIDQQF